MQIFPTSISRKTSQSGHKGRSLSTGEVLKGDWLLFSVLSMLFKLLFKSSSQILIQHLLSKHTFHKKNDLT